MRFTRYLYVSAELEKKEKKIVSRIREGKLTRPLYFLVLTDYGTRRLEIVSSLEFMQYRCPKDNILIAGMAGNYDDALELVRIILQDAYESKMEDDICAFLENREREK